jgi:hypothetical protein
LEREWQVAPEGAVLAVERINIIQPTRRESELALDRKRKLTVDRCDKQPEAEKAKALKFSALQSPRVRFSLLATLVVGVPYAANERMAYDSPARLKAMRGLVVGIWVYIAIGPMYLLISPTLVRGGFCRRFLLSLPIELVASVGVAFIPVGEEPCTRHRFDRAAHPWAIVRSEFSPLEHAPLRDGRAQGRRALLDRAPASR